MAVNGDNQGAGEVEVASYWDNFNDDIVGLIANSLHGLDYTHFRSVCKANRAIMPEVNLTSYSSPWLVFCRDHSYNIFSAVNPMNSNENYVMNLSGLEGSTIRLHKGGWLLMTRKHNIFFYNPFTRETVKLPDMDRDCYYSVVSFSSLPTSSDCIVFAMDERWDGFYIDFIRKGEAHWTHHIFDNTKMNVSFLDTAFFHDGAFVSTDCYGTFGVFSAQDNSWKILKTPHEVPGIEHPGFLVECGGDILLVRSLEYLGESVKVFKLDFSEMEWVEVESLGEYMLFVSQTSCVSAVAPNGNMKNNIYFPRLYLSNGEIVFYSLETCSYRSIGSEQSAKNLSDTKGWLENCTWIVPNRSMSTPEEIDWLKTPFLR